MAYTTINKHTDYFNTVTYTGNGATTQTITGVGFQPDWVWLKNRSTTNNHNTFDVVRGQSKRLKPNTDEAEVDIGADFTFQSDGFYVGNRGDTNGSGNSQVAWNWKAGTSSGISGGTIYPSAYSINTTSGFGIYKYTGTNSAGTIAHGLGAVPRWIIVKPIDSTGNWIVYHASMGNNKSIPLNTASANYTSVNWDSTTPTTSLFNLRAGGDVNASGVNYIAYAFAEKKGYSKFGKYTGNGNDSGTFVYTGFKPAWIMAKGMNTSDNWTLWDSKRGLINVVKPMLRADATNVESNSGTYQVDILSNGFKWRSNDSKINQDGTDYIYMAFGQSLVGSNDTPCTAR